MAYHILWSEGEENLFLFFRCLIHPLLISSDYHSTSAGTISSNGIWRVISWLTYSSSSGIFIFSVTSNKNAFTNKALAFCSPIPRDVNKTLPLYLTDQQ